MFTTAHCDLLFFLRFPGFTVGAQCSLLWKINFLYVKTRTFFPAVFAKVTRCFSRSDKRNLINRCTLLAEKLPSSVSVVFNKRPRDV